MRSLVLVTGGAGFIGSHIVDELVAAGVAVRVIDSLTETAHAAEPTYLNPQAEYVWGDLCDAEIVSQAVRGVTHVCHQAAMVGLATDMAEISTYVRQNDAGTASLLKALAERRFAGRFVLASSMVVYGEGLYVCQAHGPVRPKPRRASDLQAGRFEPPCPCCGDPLIAQAITESAAPDPRGVYAATKLHQEHLCASFAREVAGVDLVSLRYHNVYGPRMPRDTPYAGVASIFRSALAAGQPAPVFEDGNQLRDFVHVRDVARANLLALMATGPINDTLNVGSGTARSVGAMATALTRAAGPHAPDPVNTGRFRLADVRHIFASTQRLQERLGFEAQIDFEQGMREFQAAQLRDRRADLASRGVLSGREHDDRVKQIA